jgi:putative ABC transport system permease protein
MFRNNLKVALRSLWRKKTFAILNILGLSVGMSSALLVFLIIRNEKSYDTWHHNIDRIYRVSTEMHYQDGKVDYYGSVPILMPDAFRQDFTQFEQAAATWQLDATQFSIANGKKLFKEPDGMYYVEPALFTIFDYPWIEGSPASALTDPGTVAISKTIAEKWFGNWRDAMGKTVLMGDSKTPLLVTGILQDPPTNTDLPLRIAISYATYRSLNARAFANPSFWGSNSSSSELFVLLHPGQDPAPIRAQLNAFSQRHYAASESKRSAHAITTLMPVKGQHFDEQYSRYGDPNLTVKELWALTLIGLFLVLVACINFVNLSTAQSVNRAKEIGVRKVLGRNRTQLLIQFFQETALLSFLALILACIFTELALPEIGSLMGRDLALHLFKIPTAILFLLGTAVCVTFLAGFYPGLVLSGFDPPDAIKNKVKRASGGVSLRRGLVILQFVIAQLLIIATLVIIKQMAFFRNRPMGFNREAISMLDLPVDSTSQQRYMYFKDQISRIPGVLSTTLADEPPSSDNAWNTTIYFNGKANPEDFSITIRHGDSDYQRTFHMDLAAGRMPYPSDTVREVLINETAARMLGIKTDQDIIGKTVRLGAVGGARWLPIAGVMKDFNDRPLNEQEGIKPLAMVYSLQWYTMLAVHMDPTQIPSVMSRLATAYATVFPQHIFDPTFFDHKILDFYKAEAAASKLFRLFALVAIFISCLGLYGLVSFMAVQKTKEVGIRKVLGASVTSIVLLFSREFTILILVAFAVATPLGYYFMSQWLNGFYYRTDIGWEIFGIAIALSILIAWATVGYRAVRAALANPVKALKHE